MGFPCERRAKRCSSVYPEPIATCGLPVRSGGGRPGGWSLLARAAVLGKAGCREALADWVAGEAAGPGEEDSQSRRGPRLGSVMEDHLHTDKSEENINSAAGTQLSSSAPIPSTSTGTSN